MSRVRGKKTGKKIQNVSQERDRYQTPPWAVTPLLPYIEHLPAVWEPAAGDGLLAGELKRVGHHVIASELLRGQNFFTWHPAREWDVLVTNPPFSIKADWMARCYRLQRPFALLMSLDCLGTAEMQGVMKGQELEVIFLDKRINYIVDGVVQNGVPFASCWFTSGLGIGREMTFASVPEPYPLGQMALFDEPETFVQPSLLLEMGI